MLEPLATDGFRAVPLNNDWSLSTVLLAEVVHALGDEVRAASLYEVLRPAAGNCVETVEVSRAERELEHALAMSRKLGQIALQQGIEAAAGAGGAATLRAGRAAVAARGSVFRSEGDVWVVGLDGSEHRVRATKGLGYVAACSQPQRGRSTPSIWSGASAATPAGPVEG